MPPQRITMATYGGPSISVRYYEALKQHIEAQTGLVVDLLYDTDRLGPSVERGDHQHVDVAFTSTRYGLDVQQKGGEAAYVVLPVGPVTAHPDDPTVRDVGYYSVVVARADQTYGSTTEFLDLRGSKLAISDAQSFSSVTALLNKLKLSGENAAFFHTVHKLGSHEACLKSLMEIALEVAVVDNLALHNFLIRHPRAAEKLKRLHVLGPHPPPPVLVNKRLDEGTRAQILKALKMLQPQTSDPACQDVLVKLAPYGVLGFGAPEADLFDNALVMLENCQKLSLDGVYY
ncbi:uncharacterized protein LOC108668384 [Hyalella azteca]|uniref:Uncharacterized protein LOC108668384 n=1 Tax=Hyalella azteca TaxID=294128 RepID=A0A8B7NBU7_HYAAZ|nr:uncharacterized protein LOC108668384 [Hyalella azteca]XP_018011078.1 uncharacterized protein LOC108668384 [Hyalella azteca]